MQRQTTSLTPAEGLMTANDVAAYLKVSRKKVYDLIAEEGLPFIMVGQVRRFRRQDIDAWVLQQTAAAHNGNQKPKP